MWSDAEDAMIRRGCWNVRFCTDAGQSWERLYNSKEEAYADIEAFFADVEQRGAKLAPAPFEMGCQTFGPTYVKGYLGGG